MLASDYCYCLGITEFCQSSIVSCFFPFILNSGVNMFLQLLNFIALFTCIFTFHLKIALFISAYSKASVVYIFILTELYYSFS